MKLEYSALTCIISVFLPSKNSQLCKVPIFVYTFGILFEYKYSTDQQITV